MIAWAGARQRASMRAWLSRWRPLEQNETKLHDGDLTEDLSYVALFEFEPIYSILTDKLPLPKERYRPPD